jgi:hypothetical protein
MRQTVVDSVRNLQKFKRTPNGGLIIPAVFGKVGVQEYQTPQGVRREYRSESELFNPRSIESYKGATVTVIHPQGDVLDTKNYRQCNVGCVADYPHREDDLLVGEVHVNDHETINLIENGVLCEISPGYTRRMDCSPGVTKDGSSYDVVQRDIRANHVAIGPKNWNRAGGDVSLILDSGEYSVIGSFYKREKKSEKPKRKKVKQELKVGGISFSYECDDSALSQAVTKELDANKVVIDSVKSENKKLKAENEKLKSENEKFVADHLDAKAVSDLVKNRVSLEKKAEKAIGEKDFSVMSDREIKLDVLGSDFVSDGKTDDFIDGAFEAKISLVSKNAEGHPIVKSKLDKAIFESSKKSHINDSEDLLKESYEKFIKRSSGGFSLTNGK